MAILRRRIVRPHAETPSETARRLQAVQTKIGNERKQLARWMKRRRRAFHAVEKIQARLTRLEKQLTSRETS
jgi:hypothetical protein